MNALTWLAVAAGGALGSVARAALAWGLPARFPWATLVINVAGSLLIGWLMARLGPVSANNLHWHAFAVIGVCGGFTTFSSFSWQTLELFQRGEIAAALGNIALSVGLCLLATGAGWRWGQG